MNILNAARHGIDLFKKFHLNKVLAAMHGSMKGKVIDSTNYCYGLAFVLLAYSTAYKAGINEAKDYIEETFELMEKHFWQKSMSFILMK